MKQFRMIWIVCVLSFYRKMLLILVILYMHSYSTHNFPCHNFSCSLALCRQHIITVVIILLQHFFIVGAFEVKLNVFGVNFNSKLPLCCGAKWSVLLQLFYLESFLNWIETYRWNRHVLSQLRIVINYCVWILATNPHLKLLKYSPKPFNVPSQCRHKEK